MQQIYRAFIEADVVVFATPMYWGYMTAQLKAVMDRLEAVTDHFQGKTFVVLITYRHHAQSTVAFFERVCPYFGVTLHVVTCRTTDANENDIPISRCPDSLREAFDLGASLATGPRIA
jgi:multimeric flavodoxin WrbA